MGSGGGGGGFGVGYGCLASLGWLYLVQGIPYGLQDKFLPVQLRSIGLNYSSLSLLKLLLLPWIAKGLWAPVVEVYGGKQCWLLISTLGLGISSFAGSLIAPDDVVSLGAMLLAMNMCSAVQDVAVDGMALQVLPDNQLSLGNTLQVVLYKVGCLVGGAGLTLVLMYSNWTTTFNILALTYMVTGIWVYSLSFQSTASAGKVARTKDKGLLSTEKTLHSHLQFQRILSIVKEVTSSTGTLWISFYVLLYKMGERGAINNMPLYLLDKGFPKESLLFWNGTVCQGLSVLGSIYGGVTLRKPQSGVKAVIVSYSSYRFIIISIQCILIFLLDHHFSEVNISSLHYIGIASLCLLSFISGVISTATFTFMMTKSRSCSQESQASHYSMLASIEVAGKLIFASLAGIGIDNFGMLQTFSLFAFLSVLPLFVIYVTPHHMYANTKQE